MTARALLAAILVVAISGTVSARPPAPATPAGSGLDPEATTPYLWRVVIQTTPHPLLTTSFRESLRRDLLAALQPAMGALGTVEVIDLTNLPQSEWAPLWRQVADSGFAALNTDPNRDLTGIKTHFLKVEVRDGAFQLEARQYDGFSGLASPVVRRQTIRGTDLVGRAAGLMIDRDFGACGTVEPIDGRPDEARVRFRSAQLGPVDRLVKEGDVFAVARITRTTRAAPPPARTATGKLIAPPPGSVAPPALTAAILDFTYLKVVEPPKDGSARCLILTRYQAPFRTSGGVVGYRCLKIATVRAPIVVRLVGGDGKAASSSGATVRANETGFGKPPENKEILDFQSGQYRSARELRGVACVTITLGTTREARFPIPVLGPDPIDLRFEVDAKAEEKAEYERAVLAVSERAANARYGQAVCFEAVARLAKTTKNDADAVARANADALARAKAGFEAADTADKTLSEEIRQLKAESDKSPTTAKLLTRVEEQLARLRVDNARLSAYIAELGKIVAKQNDPKELGREVQAQALVARINLLLAGGEVEEALAAYDQLATVVPEAGDVKAKRDKLAEEWKPKSPEHAKARDYMLKTWPALATVTDIKDGLSQLRTAIDLCKKAKDKYAFRRLLGILGGFPTKLAELSKDLDPNAASDLKTIQDVRAIGEVLGPLEKEIADVLKNAG